MAWEVVLSEWARVDPGHYLRADGAAEVVRTGRSTWTLSWSMGLHDESTHRTAKAAMARADQQ